MKFAKFLSLGLVAFALFGCNQTSSASNDNNIIESAEQVESNVPQEQDLDSSSRERTTQTSKSSNSSKNKAAKQIGSKFDCNGDGISNGARIDYNDDGIPDDCIESSKKAKSVIDEISYKSALKSLGSVIKG